MAMLKTSEISRLTNDPARRQWLAAGGVIRIKDAGQLRLTIDRVLAGAVIQDFN